MLTKSSITVLVSPGRPGVPGQPGRDFVMFAPAPPKGYMYNAAGAPIDTYQFGHSNWNPVKAAPAVSAPVGSFPLDTKDYATMAEINAWFTANHVSGYSPSGYTMTPVVDSKTQQVVGYTRYPSYVPPVPSGWYGPINNMVYITFPNTPCDPNGHPQSGYSKADGYFDYNGVRYWGTYHNTSGVWYKVSGDPLPPGAVYKHPGIVGCPAVAAVPAVPAVAPTYRADANAGWNAGARSVASHANDLSTTFNGATNVMEVVGLYESSSEHDVTDYAAIDYGFLLTPTVYTIIERGKTQPIKGSRDAETQFVIRRIGGLVTYYVDGVPVYASRRPSFGPMRVGAALYAAPDGVS